MELCIPNTLTKIAIGSMNLLRVNKLSISRNDVELMLVYADLQLMMRPRVNPVDPHPLLTRLCLEDFEISKCLLANLRVCVLCLAILREAAQRVPVRSTDRLQQLF